MLAYVYFGFLFVDSFPSPKFHIQLVGELVELSENVTSNGAVPEVGVPIKLATGGKMLYVMVNPLTSVPVWVSGLVMTTFHCPRVFPVKSNVQVILVAETKVYVVAAISV